jgi:hypothetical protein
MDPKQLLQFRQAFGFGGKPGLGGLYWSESPDEQIEKVLGKGGKAEVGKILTTQLAKAPNPDVADPGSDESQLVKAASSKVEYALEQKFKLLRPDPLVGEDRLNPGKIKEFREKNEEIDRRIDAMASIPDEKKLSKENRYLLRAAINLRFGVKVDGELGGQALRRIYKLLKSLPADHYRNNTDLTGIQRSKPEDDGSRDPPLYRNFGGVIALPIANATEEFSVTLDGKPVGKPLSYFDHSTLHEIGHSVDANKKIMDQMGELDSMGGWRKEKIEDIAQLAYGHFTLDMSYPDSEDSMPDILLSALRGTANETDFPAPEHRGLREALAWCAKVRLNGGGGAWQLSTSELAGLAIEDRIYQQSYDKSWVSYSVTAREAAISSYQFRAPGEWFAECYAAWFSGLVPKSDARFKKLAPLFGATFV